jgi:hypothetical protein
MGAGTAACPVTAAASTVRKRENRISHNTPDHPASDIPERHHANITMSSTSFTLCNNSAARPRTYCSPRSRSPPGRAAGARLTRAAAFRTRRACAAGAMSTALRAAFSMRGAAVTPFHFLRRQFPFTAFPGREFLIGISGYTTALSRPFRSSQRPFSPNTRISVNFAQWRAHFVTHGRGAATDRPCALPRPSAPRPPASRVLVPRRTPWHSQVGAADLPDRPRAARLVLGRRQRLRIAAGGQRRAGLPGRAGQLRQLRAERGAVSRGPGGPPVCTVPPHRVPGRYTGG